MVNMTASSLTVKNKVSVHTNSIMVKNTKEHILMVVAMVMVQYITMTILYFIKDRSVMIYLMVMDLFLKMVKKSKLPLLRELIIRN